MLTVAKSFYRMSRVLPMVTIAGTLGKWHGSITEKCAEMAGYPSPEFRVKLHDDLMLGLIIHYIMCKHYLDLRRAKELDIKAIRYEDLVSDPTAACRAIMYHCNLPESLVEPAVRGMEVDSQRNSPISKKVLDQFNKKLVLTPETREFVNNLLKKSGLPLIGDDSLLPGTITCEKSLL